MKKLPLFLAALLLAAPVAHAQDNSPQAEPPKEDEADAKPAKEAKKGNAKPESKDDDRAYVDAANNFLKALAHSARKGDEGAKAWDSLKETAGDKVALKIAGESHDVDVAGKKSDVRLLNYRKISTWREGTTVKGVEVGTLEFKIGKEKHTGKGKVAMSEKDGKWTVDSVECD